MLDRIKKMFSGTQSPSQMPKDDQKLAAAALLVEAAMMDGTFDDDERTVVLNLLEERFALKGADADALLLEAEAQVENSNELYTLSRTIKNSFDNEQRIELIEMLWQVAYADGVVHEYESNLVRRLSGLLYVSDRDSGEARKRVMEKIGV
ncbi:MAG: TerB family tellurite resistance protein [Magnetovibrio sp.]|nr:TerB family tellurite resistance protein [Magnetovibrio sp.]